MKRIFQFTFILLTSSLLLSCDLEEKTDGEDACKDAAEEYLSELESCLNSIGYTLGDDPDDMAEEFCEDECDDIDKKVKTSKVDACVDEINDMDCDELMEAWDQGFEMSDCEWMEDDLGC